MRLRRRCENSVNAQRREHYLRTVAPRHRATATVVSFSFVINHCSVALSVLKATRIRSHRSARTCVHLVGPRVCARPIDPRGRVHTSGNPCDQREPQVRPSSTLHRSPSSREHLRDFVIVYDDTCWFADLQPQVFCHIAYNHYSLWSRTTTPL